MTEISKDAFRLEKVTVRSCGMLREKAQMERVAGFMFAGDSAPDDTVCCPVLGHGRTDRESRCVTKKIVALSVYSTILFLYGLTALPTSGWATFKY